MGGAIERVGRARMGGTGRGMAGRGGRDKDSQHATFWPRFATASSYIVQQESLNYRKFAIFPAGCGGTGRADIGHSLT